MINHDATEIVTDYAGRFRRAFYTAFVQAPAPEIARRVAIVAAGRETIKEAGMQVALMLEPVRGSGVPDADVLLAVRAVLEYVYVTGYEAAYREQLAKP